MFEFNVLVDVVVCATILMELPGVYGLVWWNSDSSAMDSPWDFCWSQVFGSIRVSQQHSARMQPSIAVIDIIVLNLTNVLTGSNVCVCVKFSSYLSLVVYGHMAYSLGKVNTRKSWSIVQCISYLLNNHLMNSQTGFVLMWFFVDLFDCVSIFKRTASLWRSQRCRSRTPCERWGLPFSIADIKLLNTSFRTAYPPVRDHAAKRPTQFPWLVQCHRVPWCIWRPWGTQRETRTHPTSSRAIATPIVHISWGEAAPHRSIDTPPGKGTYPKSSQSSGSNTRQLLLVRRRKGSNHLRGSGIVCKEDWVEHNVPSRWQTQLRLCWHIAWRWSCGNGKRIAELFLAIQGMVFV